MYAIIIREGSIQHAILKTQNERKFHAIAILCEKHLRKTKPEASAFYSTNQDVISIIDNHPEKDIIISELQAAESPLPKPDIIEGEFCRVNN
jgi:hypothetical protein